MKVEHLRRFREHKPFEPFAIELRSGSRIPVHHPENVVIAENAAFVRLKNGKGVLFFPEEVGAVYPIENGRRNGRS